TLGDQMVLVGMRRRRVFGHGRGCASDCDWIHGEEYLRCGVFACNRHPRPGGDPRTRGMPGEWIPAFAGMTTGGATPRSDGVGAFRSDLEARLQAGLDELVQVAVQHFLCVAALDAGAQVLDATLV